MSQEDHKIIAECKTKAQELLTTIDRYKKSSELNQSATASLETVSKAIRRTAGDLAPLSKYRIKLILMIFGGFLLINTVLLLVLLFK